MRIIYKEFVTHEDERLSSIGTSSDHSLCFEQNKRLEDVEPVYMYRTIGSEWQSTPFVIKGIGHIVKVKNTRDLPHLNKVIRRLSETQFPSPVILGRVSIRQLLPEARARKWGLAVTNPQRFLVLLFIIIDQLTQLIDIQH